jgi:hypothetical protein
MGDRVGARYLVDEGSVREMPSRWDDVQGRPEGRAGGRCVRCGPVVAWRACAEADVIGDAWGIGWVSGGDGGRERRVAGRYALAAAVGA